MTDSASHRWTATLGIVLLVAALPSGPVAAQESDLSGRWILDVDDSKDPDEVLDSLSERRSNGTGVGVGIGIFGVPVEVGRTGSRGREPAEVVRRDLRRLRPHLVSTVAELEIEQSKDAVRIRYGDRGTIRYQTGEPVEQGEESLLTEWRRDVYTIVRHVGDDLSATEEIYIDRKDADRLRWMVTLELSSRRVVRIDRYFDRAEEP
jgi:hypothetical protein